MSDIAKDPVCGINIDKEETLKNCYEQKDYCFCSESQKATFEKAPVKYTGSQKKRGGSCCG